MPKPKGAMGSPFSVTNDDMNVPTKYSHLPASEAREKIAAERQAAENVRINALVESKVQEKLKSLSANLTPQELADLSQAGLLGSVSVKKFDETGIEFQLNNTDYKIIKV